MNKGIFLGSYVNVAGGPPGSSWDEAYEQVTGESSKGLIAVGRAELRGRPGIKVYASFTVRPREPTRYVVRSDDHYRGRSGVASFGSNVHI